GIARSGEWFIADVDRRPFRAEGRRAELTIPSGTLRAGEDVVAFDVVFPVLHGPFGEDGTIQGMLEVAGIPYVGPGVKASAVAMDKDMTKRLASHAGIAVAESVTVAIEEFAADLYGVVEKVVAVTGYPAFVKPVELGSSVGITKATDRQSLVQGLKTAFSHCDRVIVEEFIRGREIEVAVTDGPIASVPGEVVLEADWYSYDAKYKDDTSQFITPAALSGLQTSEVQSLAERMFEVLGCRGLARVDFFLEESGRGFILNEVNTMPGCTPISGFPMMVEASAMSFARVCSDLVDRTVRDSQTS
ncbi:MAG TPA: D-alanine--D-alanine ligase, partial [Actinobacteria bacterium]|nr:D-alanine--D-alanine ligase [Actinomycetota bacterium]